MLEAIRPLALSKKFYHQVAPLVVLLGISLLAASVRVSKVFNKVFYKVFNNVFYKVFYKFFTRSSAKRHLLYYIYRDPMIVPNVHMGPIKNAISDRCSTVGCGLKFRFY